MPTNKSMFQGVRTSNHSGHGGARVRDAKRGPENSLVNKQYKEENQSKEQLDICFEEEGHYKACPFHRVVDGINLCSAPGCER